MYEKSFQSDYHSFHHWQFQHGTVIECFKASAWEIFNSKVFSSDLICRSAGGDLESFIELQSESELMRVLIAILICPTMGFISDTLMSLWKNYHRGSREVLYTAPAFISLISVRVPTTSLSPGPQTRGHRLESDIEASEPFEVVVSLALSLLWTNIWPTLTFIALEMGLIYVF